MKRRALITSVRPPRPARPPPPPRSRPAPAPAPRDPYPSRASSPSKHHLDPLVTAYIIPAVFSNMQFLPRVGGGGEGEVVGPRRKKKEGEQEALSGEGR